MKIIIKNLQKKIPINPARIKKAALETLLSAGAKKKGEITICFVNDRQIKELNLMYLGRLCPTDVISFDLSDNLDVMVGDIAVSTDMAIRNARIFKTTPLYELYLYVIHGVLHLLGYDDNNKANKLKMQKQETYLCSKMTDKEKKSNPNPPCPYIKLKP